ncbi:MAG: alanine--tRNA ligase [Pirellulaceae bacterium]|nr:MAG: alanine--tRNA ligase [Pirellulaceae bacterium]
MKSDELREKYLEFFESHGHVRQPSDVLVPTWDPSVLFTPAGMNQFKDHFLGKVKLEFTRATTCQKCLRTGDIDNVGRTPYHHTFFEMLGNFSFGDYFKEEAIRWAWEFLTDPRWLGMDPERLSVTVYKDDDEAAKIWNEIIGLPTSRIARMDEDENFWPASAPSQGPDGVCGPCSEIYYRLDSGKDVEIWNLVFTQFNRVGPPPNNLRPLPSKNIDTGMGLERTASVLQGKESNFHIDILYPIVLAAADVCSVRYDFASDQGRLLRRITDHVRACTFAIHENIVPGPKKARYVIKRLLRRAVLDGHQLGMREPFLYKIVPAVVDAMQRPYPELKQTTERVMDVIRREESDFFSTIDEGLARIERIFESMRREGGVMVDGAEAASLYQTYGVPPELFQTLAAEQNFTFDWDGYRKAMKRHEDISGGGRGVLFQTGPIETLKEALRHTDFLGYETTTAEAEVKGIIIRNGAERLVSEVAAEQVAAQTIRVVLDRTPFYGEGGGQVGDTGLITAEGMRFEVTDTQRAGELIIHIGRLVEGELSVGMQVKAEVDAERRAGIRRAHSATHVLHHALQTIVGTHAQQQGSKVDEDWLRFDFTNQSALTEEQLEEIEQLVVQRIQEDASIGWEVVPLVEARKEGAMMLFGEKYPDPVRIVRMGTFSKELCGGTHLESTAEIEDFEIIAEESVSAGTRRIVALTGPRARRHREEVQALLGQAAERLGCSAASVADAAGQLMQSIRDLRKQLASGKAQLPDATKTSSSNSGEVLDYRRQRELLRSTARLLNVPAEEIPQRIATLLEEKQRLEDQIRNLASSGAVSADQLLDKAKDIDGTAVVIEQIPGATPNLMRQWIDQIRQKSQRPVAVLFATVTGDDKVLLVAGLSRTLVDRGVSAGKWVGQVAQIVGGGGGGRPDLAQAGGKDPAKIDDALRQAEELLSEQLQQTPAS